MKIRTAVLEDIPQIMRLINEAKEYFRQTGNPQWQNGYPNEKVVRKDIEQKECYVLVSDEDIIGTVCLQAIQENITGEPWKNRDPYIMVNRLVIDSRFKGRGCASLLMDLAEREAKEKRWCSIRATTDDLNLSMRTFLRKSGFEECGRVFVRNNEPKLAYHKVLK